MQPCYLQGREGPPDQVLLDAALGAAAADLLLICYWLILHLLLHDFGCPMLF